MCVHICASTLCLDKAVLECVTRDSKAQCVTAMLRMAMVATAANHIQTNRTGFPMRGTPSL